MLLEIIHELQANCYEVKDHWTLAEKLGGNAINSLGSKPLSPYLEHLVISDLLLRDTDCPFPAILEVMGDPCGGRATPSPQLPNTYHTHSLDHLFSILDKLPLIF